MWALTPDMLDAQGKRCAFVTDNTLPGYDYQVEKSDYDDSGYSRGHMMPAADCRFSAKASEECAYMSNVCPQSFRLNSGAWNALEMRCREWTRVEDTLFIVCGPVYYSKEPRKIGRTHRLDVPDAFFKALVVEVEGKLQTMGFIVDNSPQSFAPKHYAVTVDSVERVIGRNLFPRADEAAEATIDWSFWKKYVY
jgi:endonuclease G